MSYPPGTKVICIDATPIPIKVSRGITGLDFTFPNGFIREGQIYCVNDAIPNNDGSYGLLLAGLPIFLGTHEANWHHSRFRALQKNTAHQKKASKSKKKKDQALPLTTK